MTGLALLIAAAPATSAQVFLSPLPTNGARRATRAPTPEQVLDTPDLEPVRALPADSLLRGLARPVGRLRIRVRGPGGIQADAWCTGVLVAANLLLTAHHCVPGNFGLQAEAATLQIPEPATQGAAGFATYAVVPAPLETSAALDYSLLRVRGHPGKRFGWARLSPQPARTGEAAAVVQFPRGGREMYARRDCRVYQTTASDFVHSCDTSWGSSGAPVYSVADGMVIGLHYAGSATANYAKQAAAILRASPLLSALEPGRGAPRPAPDTPAGRLTLAVAGRRLAARQVRESLAVLARNPGPAPHATAPMPAPVAAGPHPEPLSHWEPSGGEARAAP